MKKEEKKEFVEDSRFQALRRDAMETIFGLGVYVLVIFGICYVFGRQDPTTYTYVMGFPLWYFLCLFVSVIAVAVYIVAIQKRFSTTELEADDPEFDYDDREV